MRRPTSNSDGAGVGRIAISASRRVRFAIAFEMMISGWISGCAARIAGRCRISTAPSVSVVVIRTGPDGLRSCPASLRSSASTSSSSRAADAAAISPAGVGA
ncbi:hypothetical protein AOQ73_30900 [Bradyrhizobium pachyrhizi]|nr:hypothetical protein AOQ73_30900 [Bradyrhizobium pachyrhizi]